MLHQHHVCSWLASKQPVDAESRASEFTFSSLSRGLWSRQDGKTQDPTLPNKPRRPAHIKRRTMDRDKAHRPKGQLAMRHASWCPVASSSIYYSCHRPWYRTGKEPFNLQHKHWWRNLEPTRFSLPLKWTVSWHCGTKSAHSFLKLSNP